MSDSTSPALVLASTSPFRRELLERLRIPFDTISPEVDETALPGEGPEQLVTRLSEAKARAVADKRESGLVIGSDQMAVVGDEVLGKPGTHEQAVKQLQRLSGQRVSFLTGLCVVNAATGKAQLEMVPYHVVFRELETARIERYLRAEEPYNCAGSFKSEGLGVSLFERMEGDDPTALIGLPLIRLVRMLEVEGMVVP